LFEYIQRIRLATKKIGEFKITLPEPVQGWLLLSRAGLTPDQKTMVMTQVGKDLSFTKVSTAMETIFGQQSVMQEKSANTYVLDAEWYDDE